MNVRLLGAAVLMLLVIIAWQRQDGGDPGYRALTAQWQALFLNRDAETAYSLFVHEGTAMSSERAHTLSHVVGAVLYDRYGLDGLRYCSSEFNYGCYHGLAGHVIEERGLSGIAPLLAACEGRDPQSCRHGIGHGIMAYMGNDRLNDALAYCPVESSGPCTSGVFMEYFLNTMSHSHDRRILPFDPNNPTGPCAVVASSRYMDACYYNLPKLWRSWISRTTSDIAGQFARIGNYCEQIPAGGHRTSCYEGSGALAVPFSDYSKEAMLRICADMPEDGRDACRNRGLRSLQAPSTEPEL